jgi:Ulp1 family protease
VDIFELDKILIPINVLDNQHWIAVMVSMTEKYIQLYNPEAGKNTSAQLYFDQILRFLGDEHLNKKGGAAFLPEASSGRLVSQDPQLPTQPNGYDCGVFVSAFVYFSMLNLPFRRDSGSDPRLFAADLRFQFTRSIMTKIIHF